MHTESISCTARGWTRRSGDSSQTVAWVPAAEVQTVLIVPFAARVAHGADVLMIRD